MGFAETIAETARLARVGGLDDWYYQEYPYVLEVQADGIAAAELSQAGPAWFVFPLSPQEYEIKRVFRQSVTPTMGGVISEEAGVLWHEIHLSGTFGLLPKSTDDRTSAPDRPVAREKLSGPGWTRRMLRNVFGKYAELKANPATGHLVRMIWHDLKTDDHYVVVPETVNIPRTVHKRHQYPFNIVMKGIAEAESAVLPAPTSDLSAFGEITNALAAVGRGVALINAAVQEGSAYLGEVRFFADQIDSVISDVSRIATSAQDFVDGVASTVSVGTTFITTAATALEEIMDLIEASEELPDTVRQNYAMAVDGLHAVAAQSGAFGSTYDQAYDLVEGSELGAARDSSTVLGDTTVPQTTAAADQQRVRAGDAALVAAGASNAARPRTAYAGYREYAIQAVDSLISIAAAQLGDGALWYDLVLVNGLQPPYISAARIPGTVGVGDVIAIPTLTAGVRAETAAVDVLGTDIALTEDSNSIPGRPLVDMAIDQSTGTDVALASGLDCFKQDLQLLLWTPRGSMPLAPGYGISRSIGLKQVSARLVLLRLQAETAVRQDDRVRSISGIRLSAVNDTIELGMDIVPVGAESSESVLLSVV